MGGKLKTVDSKVVILGDADVGKTSLIVRYLEKKYEIDPENTIGAAFFIKTWGKYNIAIWDTAGQERYMGLSSFYCRNARVAILTFDLTKRETFDTLSRYVTLLDSVHTVMLKVLVGTKLDLLAGNGSRQVSHQEAEKLALALNPDLSHNVGLPYFETSSLSGTNVDRMFEYVLEFCYPKKEPFKEENPKNDLCYTVDLGSQLKLKRNNNCCI